MSIFRSAKSKWDLSPEKKSKEMIKCLKKPRGKTRSGFSFVESIKYLGREKDKRATKPLIEVLKHSTSDFKSLACEALGKIGDESAIEALIQALGDFQVKYDAKEAIKMIGEPAIKLLVQALNNDDKNVYNNARYILQDFGESSVSPLLKALEDERPQVRMQAVIALGRIGDTRAAEPLYQVMMNDIDKNVKEEAVCALGKMKDKRSVEKLMEFLIFNSSTSKSRDTIILLLGEIRDTRAVEPLIQILKRCSYYSESYSAAEALGKIGDERAVLPLIEVIKKQIIREIEWKKNNPPELDLDLHFTEDPFLNSKPVKALIRIGKPAVGPLFQLLQDMGFVDIENVLCKIGQPAVKPMIHALKSPCVKTRDCAARVLRGIKWTELEPFIQALHDDDDEFRKVIRDALQVDHAEDQLINALKDESHHVRRNIVMVLGRIGDKKASRPLMRMMLQDSHEDVRKEAALALGNLKEKSAIEPLIEILSHNDKIMMESVAEALVNIGDKRAIEPLINVLKSSDVSLIAAAEDALVKIGKPAIKTLIQVLRNKNIKPYLALNALAKIGEPAIEPLFQLIGDQSIEGDVIEALVKIGPPAVEPLIQAIKYENVGRERGYAAIVRIGEPAVRLLISLLYDKNVETNVIEALVKVGKPAIVPLKNYLKEISDSSYREKIEAIIGAISN